MKKLFPIFKNVTIVTMLCLVIIGTTTIPTPVDYDPNAGISTYALNGPDPEPKPDPDPLDDDFFD